MALLMETASDACDLDRLSGISFSFFLKHFAFKKLIKYVANARGHFLIRQGRGNARTEGNVMARGGRED